MNKYEVLGVIGEGAYGVVLKCRNKETNDLVAIKKFKENEDDDPMVRKTTLREVKMLRFLKHPNIVTLIEAFRRKGRLYLVFEYMEKNLLEVLEDKPNGIDSELVRRYVYQLCCAIHYCHENNVMHRDIKPENLLVNTSQGDHSLRLCDFGFARSMASGTSNASGAVELTEYVATRWYRAPELLLGDTKYSRSVDVWAIGCIMGELIEGQPVFPGESEIDQLYLIQKVLGPFPKRHRELFATNPRFSGMKLPEVKHPETLYRKYSGRVSKKGICFLEATLQLCPEDRLTSEECLKHPYFEGLAAASETPSLSHHQPAEIKPLGLHNLRDQKAATQDDDDEAAPAHHGLGDDSSRNKCWTSTRGHNMPKAEEKFPPTKEKDQKDRRKSAGKKTRSNKDDKTSSAMPTTPTIQLKKPTVDDTNGHSTWRATSETKDDPPIDSRRKERKKSGAKQHSKSSKKYPELVPPTTNLTRSHSRPSTQNQPRYLPQLSGAMTNAEDQYARGPSAITTTTVDSEYDEENVYNYAVTI